MKLLLVGLVSLLVGATGGYFLSQQKTDWSDQGPAFEKAITEAVLSANSGADAEMVKKVSKCLSGKIVEHLSAPEATCCLPAPKSTEDALKVVDSCVGPAAGLYFQSCLLELQ